MISSLPAAYHFAFAVVHGVTLRCEACGNCIAASFAVDEEEPVFAAETLAHDQKIANLPVMRQFRVEIVEDRLHRCPFYCAANHCAEITPAITDEHRLCPRYSLRDFLFHRLGRDVVA